MLRTCIVALALPFTALATAPCPPVHVDAVTGERPPPCLTAGLDDERSGTLVVHNGCAEPARIRLDGVEASEPTDRADFARPIEVDPDGHWVLAPGEGGEAFIQRPTEAEATLTLAWSVGAEAGVQQWALVDLCAGGAEPEGCRAVPGSGTSSSAVLWVLLAALRRRRPATAVVSPR